MRDKKGITLIALVITIIILLILASISIAMLTGGNGVITKAMKAKEETEIKAYYEKIELIKQELRLQKEDYSPPSLVELQTEFGSDRQANWVESAVIQEVEEKDQVVLKTKEGYIFYITETKTEYKGKGEVKDTSALTRENVLTLEEVGDGTKGRLVKITANLKPEEDYYEIEYNINSEDGEWTKIKNGETVDVPYSSTIYARLIYVTNKGTIYRLEVGASDPKIVAKTTDTNNIIRKINEPLSELFEITWGSDGTGNIEYNILGNLNFKNTSFTSTEINNLAQLEIGIYNVTCKITSPSNKTATAQKSVKITKLAETTVTNANNDAVSAFAIYSEYDLAYFRDLVNGGQFTINGQLKNDIDLSNVCSASVGNWIPIGEFKTNVGLTDGSVNAEVYFNGIFDGMNNKIEKIYINSSTLYRQGLFSIIRGQGLVKNLEVSGSITAYQTAARYLWNKQRSNK